MNQLTTVPAHIAARKRSGIIDDARSGLGVSRPAHLSIRGGQFALVRSDGARYQVPTTHLDIVICDALRETSRIMYPSKFEEGSPPICFSDNGVGPSVDALQPQSPLCETCWANVRGSAQTFSGKDTTACDRRKKIAFFLPGDPQINLYEFQIGPGSLGNFKDYVGWIGQQAGELDVADFVTRVAQDPQKPNTYKFEAVGWVDEAAIRTLQAVVDRKLSDAVVNRGDKPCDPATVARMLQGRGSSAALPAPDAPQQFQLPPPSPQAPVVGPAPAFTQAPHAQSGPAPSQFQPFSGVRVTGHEPVPTTPAAPVTRTRGRPKAKGADPVAAGVQAPAAPAPAPQAPPQFTAPAATGGPAPAFSPPGFVQQHLAPMPPNTRLQEAANYNPAPAPPQFGMQQPASAPQSLADAMNMLPPRQ